MGRRPLLTIMLLGVAIVVTILLGALQRGRESILREFQSAQARLAQTASNNLRGYLESFDADTRLAAALAEETRSQSSIDRRAQGGPGLGGGDDSPRPPA